MVMIKIFGERNTGTNYLHKLFSKNFKNIKLDKSINKKFLLGWKHGIPKYNLLDWYEKKDKIIYICIFRDLRKWLNSMYKHSYHILNNTDFYNYITRDAKIRKTDNLIDFNYKHERTNLFNMRYFKFSQLLKLSKKKKNVVLSVGISDLNEFKVDLTKQSIKINDHFDLIIVLSKILFFL